MTSTAVRRQSRAGTIGALLLGIGGVILASMVRSVDHMTLPIFILTNLGDFVGFALVVTGTTLAASRSSSLGRAFMIAGAATWLVGWSWAWHAGLVFPVPFWIWAAIAALAYLSAAIAYFVHGALSAGSATVPLLLGSLGSMMPPLLSPVFIPDYTYVPFSVGAICAAVLAFFEVRRSSHGGGGSVVT